VESLLTQADDSLVGIETSIETATTDELEHYSYQVQVRKSFQQTHALRESAFNIGIFYIGACEVPSRFGSKGSRFRKRLLFPCKTSQRQRSWKPQYKSEIRNTQMEIAK